MTTHAGRACRDHHLTLRHVVAAVASVVMLSGCGLQAYDLPLPGEQVAAEDGYQVTAEFRDVVDVVPRTLVMANDVPVGQVDEVERDGWHARVEMTVRDNIKLPSNAVAHVRQTSLLGEKYIALSAPSDTTVKAAGRLSDGDVIPLSRSSRNPEVEEVLGALSFLLSGGGVGQLKTISTELNALMSGRESEIADVLNRLDTLVGSLDEHKGSIIAAMENVDELTRTLNREKKAIGEAIDSFPPALEVLRKQHDGLMTMLDSLNELETVATRVINESGDELTASLRHLEPVLRELANAGDSLPAGAMMAASFPFPKQAETLAKGDYSNAMFHMEFDLGKILEGLTTTGETGLPNLLDVCVNNAPGCEQVRPVLSALCDLTNQPYLCGLLKDPTERAPKPEGAKQSATKQEDGNGGNALDSFTDDVTGEGDQDNQKNQDEPADDGGIASWWDNLFGGTS